MQVTGFIPYKIFCLQVCLSLYRYIMVVPVIFGIFSLEKLGEKFFFFPFIQQSNTMFVSCNQDVFFMACEFKCDADYHNICLKCLAIVFSLMGWSSLLCIQNGQKLLYSFGNIFTAQWETAFELFGSITLYKPWVNKNWMQNNFQWTSSSV